MAVAEDKFSELLGHILCSVSMLVCLTCDVLMSTGLSGAGCQREAAWERGSSAAAPTTH